MALGVPQAAVKGAPLQAAHRRQARWQARAVAGDSIINVHPKKREGSNREITSFSSSPHPPQTGIKMMAKRWFLYIKLARTGSIIFVVPRQKHCTTTAISIMIAIKLFPILFC